MDPTQQSREDRLLPSELEVGFQPREDQPTLASPVMLLLKVAPVESDDFSSGAWWGILTSLQSDMSVS